jgi:ribosomal protein L11 methyltransferase
MTTARPYTWRKLSAARWEDSWIERLRSVADRLAITSFASGKTIRLEAFQLTRAQADALARTFGGQAAPQKREIALQPPTSQPIRVRDKLIVASSQQSRDALAAEYPNRHVLWIPAGMAFGTGDHATTATCLRLLCDISGELKDWDLLDLGCGTGILALAGRALGARSVEAGDFDKDAVRVAKENVRANGLSKVRVSKLDVRTWTPPRTWSVVAANLFSGLLMEVASKLAQATAPGGRLVFSGVLKTQEAEVLAAFKAEGLRIDQRIRKGKWVAGLATRTR